MTIEEAIKTLGFIRIFDAPELKKALEMAVDALHAQKDSNLVDFDHFKPAKLDRSRWEGCEHCKADREGYSVCFKDEKGHSKKLYIPEGESAIVIAGRYDHKAYIPIAYCPSCGRPLTDEAWAELERRLNL